MYELMMQTKNSFFTVVVRPIPRGITKDDLLSHHLSRFGQIRNLRFGDTRGSSGDVMFIDFFDFDSASAAADALNGTRDPGTSNLLLSATLSKASIDAASRLKVLEVDTSDPQPIKRSVSQVRVDASIKYLKSKGNGEVMCILDLESLGET